MSNKRKAKLNATKFLNWLGREDVRDDILTAVPYEGFRELTYAEDEFAQMLVRRYSPMTLAEIAAVSGLSRERVRQIQEEALDKERVKRAEGQPSFLDEYDEPPFNAVHPVGRRGRSPGTGRTR